MPKMTGARLFAEMMQGYGITHIFFVPGELRSALKKALGLNKPVVIDAVSDKNVLAKRVAH